MCCGEKTRKRERTLGTYRAGCCEKEAHRREQEDVCMNECRKTDSPLDVGHSDSAMVNGGVLEFRWALLAVGMVVVNLSGACPGEDVLAPLP